LGISGFLDFAGWFCWFLIRALAARDADLITCERFDIKILLR
jgi:hypothetical protein